VADYEMKGYLGKNKNRAHDRQPTHRGQCTIDGVEYWISAWTKDGKDGKFLSLAFDKKEQQPTQTADPEPEEMDDDIPF
jgi:hypothetical protein